MGSSSKMEFLVPKAEAASVLATLMNELETGTFSFGGTNFDVAGFESLKVELKNQGDSYLVKMKVKPGKQCDDCGLGEDDCTCLPTPVCDTCGKDEPKCACETMCTECGEAITVCACEEPKPAKVKPKKVKAEKAKDEAKEAAKHESCTDCGLPSEYCTCGEKPKYKKLKKRMNGPWKEILSSLRSGQMPAPTALDIYIHDARLMCTYPGKGDEFYEAFLKEVDVFEKAVKKKDLDAALQSAESQERMKKDCHKKYD